LTAVTGRADSTTGQSAITCAEIDVLLLSESAVWQ